MTLVAIMNNHSKPNLEDECEHAWVDVIDSQFSNELFTEVHCHRCAVVGERSTSTGDVYYPAT